jgi:hypothetical protein
MVEWYTPDHFPQHGVPLLAYYDNSPNFLYIDNDGNWRSW